MAEKCSRAKLLLLIGKLFAEHRITQNERETMKRAVLACREGSDADRLWETALTHLNGFAAAFSFPAVDDNGDNLQQLATPDGGTASFSFGGTVPGAIDNHLAAAIGSLTISQSTTAPFSFPAPAAMPSGYPSFESVAQPSISPFGNAAPTSPGSTKNFKVMLVGDGGTGKTMFVNHFKSGEFNTKYVPTFGVAVTPVKFETNHGPIQFSCWDCAGQQKFGGQRDGYYIQAQACIFFFDVTCRDTYDGLHKWYEGIARVCGSIKEDHEDNADEDDEGKGDHLDIAAVVVGNKVDAAYREVDPKQILFPRKRGCPYFDISCKANINLEKPFLTLARQLTGCYSVTRVCS
eukprot:TRINITY_DN3548_c0_g1_i1.p1 TRINITY_DN3548_c0_g1~~TRINITY_DN3548_c0_g1_i1.p1  ORF type:complete len:348 (-),score=48.58 TRINITY_DN3548_c0_g1_i1:40-1083(-)